MREFDDLAREAILEASDLTPLSLGLEDADDKASVLRMMAAKFRRSAELLERAADAWKASR